MSRTRPTTRCLGVPNRTYHASHFPAANEYNGSLLVGVPVLLAGLLEVDPHHLFIDWNLSGLGGLMLTLPCCGDSEAPTPAQSPRVYRQHLSASRHYQSEIPSSASLAP